MKESEVFFNIMNHIKFDLKNEFYNTLIYRILEFKKIIESLIEEYKKEIYNYKKIEYEFTQIYKELESLEKTSFSKLINKKKLVELKQKKSELKTNFKACKFKLLDNNKKILELCFEYFECYKLIKNKLEFYSYENLIQIKDKLNIKINKPDTLYFDEKQAIIEEINNIISKINNIDIENLMTEMFSKVYTLDPSKITTKCKMKFLSKKETIKNYYIPIELNNKNYFEVYDYFTIVENKFSEILNVNSLLKNLGINPVGRYYDINDIPKTKSAINDLKKRLFVAKKEYLIQLNQINLIKELLPAVVESVDLESDEEMLDALESNLNFLEFRNKVFYDIIKDVICTKEIEDRVNFLNDDIINKSFSDIKEWFKEQEKLFELEKTTDSDTKIVRSLYNGFRIYTKK